MGRPSHALVMTAGFLASVRKSSSSCAEAAKASASSTTPSAAAHRVRSSSIRASRQITSRSRSTTGLMPGRWTLTTTGSGSNCAKASATGRPYASRSTASTSVHGAGGAWDWSRLKSVTNAGGSRSSRVESIWPSFTNVVPASSGASRSGCAGWSLLLPRPPGPRPRRYGRSPCRTMMELMWE